MSWLAATKRLPFLVYLATTAVGSLAAPSITDAINASGTITFCDASNEPVTPQRETPESQPNASASVGPVCWTAIPPSPWAF